MPGSASDLTKAEQANVRLALQCLHRQLGMTLEQFAKALRYTDKTIRNVFDGRTVTASMAFRAARLAGVTVDDVVSGRFPPVGWTCPYCGNVRRVAPESDGSRAVR
jgi:hypothetical protein